MTAKLAYLGNKLSRPERSARTGEAVTVAKYINQHSLGSKSSKKFKVRTIS